MAALEACAAAGARKSNGKPDGFKATCPTHDDKQASLSVWVEPDGTIEVTCHAGCQSDDIIAALGFTWQDRLPPESEPRHTNGNGHAAPAAVPDPVAPHPPIEYICEDGAGTRWTHIRTGAKGMRWTPTGPGSPDRFYVPRPLPSGGTLVITEGEKDADALAAAGIPVVGMAGGAASTPSLDALDRALGTAVAVILWPDADGPGMKFMNRVGNLIRSMGRPVRHVLPDPDWPKGWGAADVAYPGVNAYDLHVAVASGAEPVAGGKERLRAEMTARVTDGVPIPASLVVAPTIKVRPLGTQGWVVSTHLGDLTFRNVVTHRDLSADISVDIHGERIVRAQMMLGLNSRKSLAEVLVKRSGGVGTIDEWQDVIYAAFEAVMHASETLPGSDDLRMGAVTSITQTFVVSPVWATGATMLVAPGELGKSTFARALAVSIASGREVIPGLPPQVTGPVLYVASEDAVTDSHRNKVEAICRGAGIDRTTIDHPIRFVSSSGRPLHRIAGHISEAATGYAGVILDAMQGLLAAGDDVRNEAAIFWNAVDEIGVPVFVVSHPNKSTSQQWNDSDGRAAGAEVNRDRARMSWKATMSDLPSIAGTWTSAIRLENTKNNDGPRLPDVMLNRTWSPTEVTFSPGSGMGPAKGLGHGGPARGDRPSKAEQEIIEAWEQGLRTPAQMQQNIRSLAGEPYNTLKTRIRRMKEKGWLGGLDEDD